PPAGRGWWQGAPRRCGSGVGPGSGASAEGSRSRSTLAARAFGTALSCCRPHRGRTRRNSVIGWSPLAMIAAGSRLTDVCVDLSPCRVERAGALIGARAHASQRAFFGHYMIVAALLLVAAALPAWAQETCSAAFAQWVKRSEPRTGKPGGDGGVEKPADSQGACIAGEPQRRELLRALASVRDRCQASTATDAESEHVRMMIGINEGFIGSVALCPSEASHKEAAKAEGAPATPRARPRQC